MDKFLKRQTVPSTFGGSYKTKTKKKRLYDENYLNFGFTVIDNKPHLLWNVIKRKHEAIKVVTPPQYETSK